MSQSSVAFLDEAHTLNLLDSIHFKIANEKHYREIEAAYNAGYRDGQMDAGVHQDTINNADISEFTNAKQYYMDTFVSKGKTE
jgi:hypothetical protein